MARKKRPNGLVCSPSRSCDDKPWVIYGLVDPSTDECRYIGSTVNIKSRLTGHISEAKNDLANHRKATWIKSLLRQGLKPEYVVLRNGYGPGRDEEEIALIKRYKTIDPAMNTNSTIGGDGVFGYIPTPEVKARIVATRMARYPAKPKSPKMRVGECSEKPVICLSTGIVYRSAMEAERQTGHSRVGIGNAIKNGGSCGKMFWSYISKDGVIQPFNVKVKKAVCLKVRRIEDGVEFNSATEAAKSVGLVRKSISDACRKKNKSGGFTWEYIYPKIDTALELRNEPKLSIN